MKGLPTTDSRVEAIGLALADYLHLELVAPRPGEAEFFSKLDRINSLLHTMTPAERLAVIGEIARIVAHSSGSTVVRRSIISGLVMVLAGIPDGQPQSALAFSEKVSVVVADHLAAKLTEGGAA